MKRFVSLFFPFWPVERMGRRRPEIVAGDAPLVLVTSGRRGIEITGLNRRAEAEGLWVGQALADARAMLPGLKSLPAETAKDTEALRALAYWCGRYGPQRNVHGEDGLWIDVTGVAHLFGGEDGLINDLVNRIEAFGFTVWAGLADTFAAADGMARFAPMAKGRRFAISPTGSLSESIAPLPVDALRLTPEAVLLLQRLGLRRVGQLYDIPRASLERRFNEANFGKGKKTGAGLGAPKVTRMGRRKGMFATKMRAADRRELAVRVLLRLDQVLGEISEPLAGLLEPPVLSVRQSWSDPLISTDGIEAEVGELAVGLVQKLEAQGLGCRRVQLLLYRADGTVVDVAAGTSMACRDGKHLMRLLSEKFASIDAGFGIDVAELNAVEVAPMEGAQQDLSVGQRGGGGAKKELGELIDRLTNRLGAGSVKVLEPSESYLPERADRLWPARAVVSDEGRGGQEVAQIDGVAGVRVPQPPRPFLLLAPPEPIRVKLHEGSCRLGSFVWRRVDHQVLRLEGPERIAPEWWRGIGRPHQRLEGVRDYYRIEVQGGARYWVFQELCDGNLDGDLSGDDRAREGWFLHGLYGGVP